MKKPRTSESVEADIAAHGNAATLQAFALRNLRKINTDLGRGLVAALKVCNMGGGRSFVDPGESYLDVLSVVRSPVFTDVAVAAAALKAAEADEELQDIARKLDPLLDELAEAQAREAEARATAAEERKRRAAQLEAAEAAAIEAARNAPELVKARQELEAIAV
jgi:hypothetical protein